MHNHYQYKSYADKSCAINACGDKMIKGYAGKGIKGYADKGIKGYADKGINTFGDKMIKGYTYIKFLFFLFIVQAFALYQRSILSPKALISEGIYRRSHLSRSFYWRSLLSLKPFIAATALFFFTASFAQQPQSLDADMRTIARQLITETYDAYVDTEPAEVTSRYIRFRIRDDEGNKQDLKMYRYECPDAEADFVLVDDCLMLRCFTLERKSGTLTAAELPFELLPPSQFNKEEFDEEHSYWRVNGNFSEKGDIVITASPGMSYLCLMLAQHDGKGGFKLHRRAGYDFVSFEITGDDAEKEKYVQNIVRPNFQRINAITKWALTEEGLCLVSSIEHAKLVFYYSHNGLEKIVAKLNDKTYDRVIEYYFLDGLLSFVFDVNTQSGVKTERRWYLKNNTCFRGIGDNGKKLTPAQIEAEFLNDSGAYSYYTLFLRSEFRVSSSPIFR